MSAIADAVRWAEEIMKGIDESCLLVGEVLGSPCLSGAHMFNSQNLRQKDALKQF